MLGRSAVKKLPKKLTQKIVTIPAPIGGLNARDSLAAMPETDAYSLINWIPQRYGVRSRKGYTEWATGLTGSVGTVLTYFSASTTIPSTTTFLVAPTTMPGKVFAATDVAIYDITTTGAGPAISQALSGAANAGSLSSVNFTNSGGSFLLAASEIDGYFVYDGAAWNKVTLGGGANQVSVVDPTTFCAVAIWKRRLWAVVKSTSKVCYLPVDSIYGAATVLDLGPLLKHGGSIAWIANWTIDAGEGIDDLLVIASENGDIIIYKGTDPASATTFALQGVWYAGELPKGRRGFTTYGGDLLILCNLGILPLSVITRGGAGVLSPTTDGNYTSKIQELFSQDISETFNLFGWDLCMVPRESLLLANVPQTVNGLNVQYALTTSGNQWCQFNGMPMTCIKTVANWPMFGSSNGKVYIAFLNFRDNNLLDGTLGDDIAGQILPAFSLFSEAGQPTQNKHFLMVQPTFLGVSEPSYVLQMNVNFVPNIPAASPVAISPVGSLWDVGLWDHAVWGGSQAAYRKWSSVEGVGYSGELALRTRVNTDTTLVTIDYMIELGGPM